MAQVEEMTELEQYEMYMKSTKSELVKMLIEANKHLGYDIKPEDKICTYFVRDDITTAGNCINCGQQEWLHN